ncbi:O-fucosyltransferase 2 [Camellia lanceoleosa]|uniref:O-fucosyltransferase 2 n=1 Tax=Camellia lanceoleosa TaxID=1840588 RepID=A0ACC0GYU7_9ERIC|nr:O-fucosyltransferase 2 [Camellia lanceoleosa]
MKGVVVVVIVLLACFVVMDWWMLSQIQESSHGIKFKYKVLRANSSTLFIREELERLGKVKKPQKTIYARLLAKATHALAEGQNKPEPRDLWQEPFILVSSWRPCADQQGNNGYILVSANGEINQQQVAEEHFINYLKPDIRIVKELPLELQSLDLEAIGSVVTDADIMKEAKPSFYSRYILPILHRHRVVHFVGFGNRLSFDPLLYCRIIYKFVRRGTNHVAL